MANVPYKSPRDVPPSQRKRPKWVPCPEGLKDVWRVSYHETEYSKDSQWRLAGFFLKEDLAWSAADALHTKKCVGIRVEHKAGLELNGKLYLVNILPIKVKAQDDLGRTNTPPTLTEVNAGCLDPHQL